MIDFIMPAIVAAVTAAVYGGYAYLAGRIGTAGEPFDFQKLAGTVIVGAVVGLAFAYMGLPINEAAIVAAMTTIGAVEVGQKTVKGFINLCRVVKGKLFPDTML